MKLLLISVYTIKIFTQLFWYIIFQCFSVFSACPVRKNDFIVVFSACPVRMFTLWNVKHYFIGTTVSGWWIIFGFGLSELGITGNYKNGKGGKLSKLADISLIVNTTSMERIEDIHLIINHIIKEYIKDYLLWVQQILPSICHCRQEQHLLFL